jgi:hypothetical protein
VQPKKGSMTQEPRPTDQPESDTAAPELDTEGHSLLNAEFANSVVRDRQREDARIVRDEARRHELKKPGRTVRSRLLGR